MTETIETTSSEPVTDSLDELVNEAFKCLECGKCTGSCPMVELFPNDFHPHHLLTDLIHNPEKVLSGHNLWFCASCYKCNKRCPQALEFPYIVMKARKLALQANGLGSLQKAYHLISESIPFPLSFLSVCIHPERIDLDPSVIEILQKTYVLDPANINLPEPDLRVAVAGSGPAGLMAAYELRKMGYQVTVFESQSIAGGMFSQAIPEYRVPLKIVEDEVEKMKRLGIEIKLKTRVGKDVSVEKLFSEGYKAILLTTGAHQCKKLDIKGEDFEGVYDTLEFLMELKIKKKDIKNKTITVIGGGNTAMDSASAAIRYGAKEVFLLYRRTKEEMPADINEIREAENDGVQIRYLENPLSIIGEKSRVNQLECIKMELGKPDLTGRRRPIPVEGSNFILDTDHVVIAIGEQPETDFFPKNIATGSDNSILVNPLTMETGMPGVFAAGDAVSGPATVADAIIGAKKAAIGIDSKIQSS